MRSLHDFSFFSLEQRLLIYYVAVVQSHLRRFRLEARQAGAGCPQVYLPGAQVRLASFQPFCAFANPYFRREDSKRTLAFVNEGDFISFRHHVFVKTSHKEVQLAEVGPRFEMRPYEIRNGTIEQQEADVEWVLRRYMRTGRKRNQL